MLPISLFVARQPTLRPPATLRCTRTNAILTRAKLAQETLVDLTVAIVIQAIAFFATTLGKTNASAPLTVLLAALHPDLTDAFALESRRSNLFATCEIRGKALPLLSRSTSKALVIDQAIAIVIFPIATLFCRQDLAHTIPPRLICATHLLAVFTKTLLTRPTRPIITVPCLIGLTATAIFINLPIAIIIKTVVTNLHNRRDLTHTASPYPFDTKLLPR
jgi:hypothetical protein